MTPYDLLVATRRLIADVNRNPLQYPSAQALLLQHLEAVRAELYRLPGVADDRAEDLRDALRTEQTAQCGREAPASDIGNLSMWGIRTLREAALHEAGRVKRVPGLTEAAYRALVRSLVRRGLAAADGHITPAGRTAVQQAAKLGL